jgi:hypothetical protein
VASAAFARLPRSRDRRSAFRAKGRPVNGVLTPPWVFVDLLPFLRRGGDGSTSFRATRTTAIHRRCSRRPRSPFTPAAFPFRGCCTGAYSRPMSPLRLLQLQLTCGHCDRSSRVPRRDGGRNLLPFLTHRPLRPVARQVVMRVEPRFVRRTTVRCWFLRLPGLPNRESSSDAPPLPAFTERVSDDRRARALGPSEGRVTERVSSVSCRSNGCVALVAHADNRSPPRRPRDTPRHRRARSKGRDPFRA